jgi:hypothetical protein
VIPQETGVAGNSPVSTILQDLDEGGLRRSRVAGQQHAVFNMDLEQYPVLNGIILLAPDAVNTLGHIADYVETNNLWTQWRMHLTLDVLIPLTKHQEWQTGTKDEVTKYTLMRSRHGHLKINDDGFGLKQRETEAIRRSLENFYKWLNSNGNSNLQFKVHVPHKSVFCHVAGPYSDEAAEKFKRLLHVRVAEDDHAMVTHSVKQNQPVSQSAETPGGVDLSKTKSSILFKNKGSSSGERSIPVLQDASLLRDFQGFDFKIIQFQPIVNPEGMFLGSSVQACGSWFFSQSALV